MEESDCDLGDDDMEYQEDNIEGTKDAQLSDNNEYYSTDKESGGSGGRVRKIPKGDAPTPRRSRRISERKSKKKKTHSPKKTRKSFTAAEKDKQAAILEMIAQINKALEEEQLESELLQEGLIEKVNEYCGTHLGNRLIPLEGATSNLELQAAISPTRDMYESILKSLE